jgi:hypothetical protein
MQMPETRPNIKLPLDVSETGLIKRALKAFIRHHPTSDRSDSEVKKEMGKVINKIEQHESEAS